MLKILLAIAVSILVVFYIFLSPSPTNAPPRQHVATVQVFDELSPIRQQIELTYKQTKTFQKLSSNGKPRDVTDLVVDVAVLDGGVIAAKANVPNGIANQRSEVWVWLIPSVHAETLVWRCVAYPKGLLAKRCDPDDGVLMSGK